jgi:hypothetical protein
MLNCCIIIIYHRLNCNHPFQIDITLWGNEAEKHNEAVSFVYFAVCNRSFRSFPLGLCLQLKRQRLVISVGKHSAAGQIRFIHCKLLLFCVHSFASKVFLEPDQSVISSGIVLFVIFIFWIYF